MGNIVFAVVYIFTAAAYSAESNPSLLTSKIIGGHLARKEFNSHVVAIGTENYFYGVASLISLQHAITSPFCVYKIPQSRYKKVFITVGSLSLINGIRYYIYNIKYGWGYDHLQQSPSANFAIVYLTNPVIDPAYVKPIPVLCDFVDSGTKAFVAGWGSTRFEEDFSETVMADNLRELSVTVLANENCTAFCRGQLNEFLMCTRDLSRQRNKPHYGDIGDPLVTEQRELIGIVYSISTNYISDVIYARLSHHYYYILKVITPSQSQEEISIPESYGNEYDSN